MANTATIAWTTATNAPAISIGASDNKTGAGNALAAHALTSVTAGALLIIMSGSAVASAVPSVSSSPALTWIKRAYVNDSCCVIFTAVFAAGGNINVTTAWDNASTAFSLCQIATNQNAVTNGNSLITVTRNQGPDFGAGCTGIITTIKDNSVVFGVVCDRTNTTGTITYRGSATQIFAAQTGPCFYTFYKVTTTAGNYTLGMSSPSTGAGMGLCLFEIRTG